MDWKKQSTLKITCVQMAFVQVLEALVNLEGFKFRFSLHAEFVWGLASGFTKIPFCVIFFLPEGRMQVIKKLIAYTKHSQKEKIILVGMGVQFRYKLSSLLHFRVPCMSLCKQLEHRFVSVVKSLIEYNLDSTLIHLGKWWLFPGVLTCDNNYIRNGNRGIMELQLIRVLHLKICLFFPSVSNNVCKTITYFLKLLCSKRRCLVQ